MPLSLETLRGGASPRAKRRHIALAGDHEINGPMFFAAHANDAECARECNRTGRTGLSHGANLHSGTQQSFVGLLQFQPDEVTYREHRTPT
jgi:hypothetical protein